MSSAPLPWQESLLAHWLARRDAWPHALLLHGPPGFGKRRLAEYLAQSQLCEQPTESGRPCRSCVACGWVAERQHPDLRWVEPQTDEAETEGKVRAEIIRIEQVRALTDFVMLSAHRRTAKIVVICPAEAMNLAASNALLKTLEEPPPGTFLLLVSDYPGRLPATILSRCAKLPAPRPRLGEAIEWLRAQTLAEPENLLAQAGGAPLRALTLAEGDFQTERRYFLGELAQPQRLSAIALGARLDAVPKPGRKVRLGQWLDWLATWSYDLAALASGENQRYHPDFGVAATALGTRLAPLPLIRYHRQVLLQKRLITHPLTPRLVAEQMLQGYREAVASASSA